MKNFPFLPCLFLLILMHFSCETKKKENQKEDTVVKPVIEEEAANIIFESIETTAFPDASIEMYSPLGNETFKEGNVPFEFNIKNYPKKDGPGKFILRMSINGDEPINYHSPIFKLNFNSGTYRAVAYLLDEEGIALKDFGNYVQRDFLVGNSRPFPESDEPYMILNLPANEQVFTKGEPVIVDFLLIGGGLREDGLKFLLSVNGIEQEINNLLPIRIINLPPGIHEVSIKLVRNSGEELSGIFSAARRKIRVG